MTLLYILTTPVLQARHLMSHLWFHTPGCDFVSLIDDSHQSRLCLPNICCYSQDLHHFASLCTQYLRCSEQAFMFSILKPMAAAEASATRRPGKQPALPFWHLPLLAKMLLRPETMA